MNKSKLFTLVREYEVAKAKFKMADARLNTFLRKTNTTMKQTRNTVKKPNSHKDWTPNEVETMNKMLADNRTVRQVAIELGRSKSAVRTRMYRDGLKQS